MAAQSTKFGALDPLQQATVLKILERQNVVIYGMGGTGKTLVIGVVAELLGDILAREGDGKRVVLTATTNAAAALLTADVATPYSLVGFVMIYDAKTKKFGPSRPWWNFLKPLSLDLKHIGCLVIDEISMMPLHMFLELDKVFRKVRGVNRPFGGVQLVCVGDPLQLAPVQKPGMPALESLYGSALWEKTFQYTANFETMHRQGRDPVYQQVMREMRVAKLSPESCAVLESRVGLVVPPEAVCVCPRKTQVDQMNNEYLARLPGESIEFVGRLRIRKVTEGSASRGAPIQFGVDGSFLNEEKLRDDCVTPFSFALKVGARVIITAKVVDLGVYNGTQGTFLGMTADKKHMRLRLDRDAASGEPDLERLLPQYTWTYDAKGQMRKKAVLLYTNFPVTVGRATTVHRMQGMELDKIRLLPGSFGTGMVYTACSRVRDCASLYIDSFDKCEVKADKQAVLMLARCSGLNQCEDYADGRKRPRGDAVVV